MVSKPHFSPWLPGQPLLYRGPNLAREVRHVARRLTVSATGNYPAVLNGMRQTIMNGGGESWNGLVEVTTNPDITFYSWMRVTITATTVELWLGYTAVRYNAYDVPDSNPPGYYLSNPISTPPVDLNVGPLPVSAFNDTLNPYTYRNLIQWQGRGTNGGSRNEWLGWAINNTGASVTYREMQFNNYEGDLTHPYQNARIAFSALSTLGHDEWLPYKPGKFLGTITLPIKGVANNQWDSDEYNSGNLLGFGDYITTPDVWLVAQPTFMDPNEPLPYGLTPPAGFDDALKIYSSLDNRLDARISGSPDTAPFFGAADTIFQSSPYRYYIEPYGGSRISHGSASPNRVNHW